MQSHPSTAPGREEARQPPGHSRTNLKDRWGAREERSKDPAPIPHRSTHAHDSAALSLNFTGGGLAASGDVWRPYEAPAPPSPGPSAKSRSLENPSTPFSPHRNTAPRASLPGARYSLLTRRTDGDLRDSEPRVFGHLLQVAQGVLKLEEALLDLNGL